MDDPFTIDDRGLLRAIEAVDDPHGTTSVVLKEQVVDHPEFKVLAQNQHLRELLRAFLEVNIRIAHIQNQLTAEQSKGRLASLIHRGKLERLKKELAQLKPLQNETFRAYEMLRKLTDNDNFLLRRYRS